MNTGGGCTGAHALPPQGEAVAAAAATNSGNLLGMTRNKRPATIDETAEAKKLKQRHHYHLQVFLGKRKYEYGEYDDVDERENAKMFKCNYWEDPAYAKKLQRDGLSRERIAALDSQMERLLKHGEFDEPPQQPEPLDAGASDPPIPNCTDRYRRYDHDYW